MKLSFSTLACPSWSVAEIVDAADRFGYDGVELRFVAGDDALWAHPDLSGAGLGETIRRLADAALAVPCVDTRSFCHHPAGAERERSLDEAVRSLELAAQLGASGIRVFGDRVQPGQDWESTTRLVADALEWLAERARPLGVEVWIESHGDFADAHASLRVLDRVPSAFVGALWDPANAFEAGEAPADGYAALKARLRHVHLKDLAPLEGGAERRWVPVLPGRGVLRPERVLDVLAAGGYAGWISFEWEKKWHSAIEEPEVALPFFIQWMASVRPRL